MSWHGENLLDGFDQTFADAALEAPLGVIPPHRPNTSGDLILVRRSPDVDETRVAGALAGRMAGTCTTPGGQLMVRCDDGEIQAVGEALEAGDPAVMDASDIACDQRHVVCFCDPNATKALHVGHLRNIAIGHGVASVLRAAGADVVEQCHVCDIGRAMGEALAGYATFGDRATPIVLGMKPDHFVGECYRRYVATLDVGAGDDGTRDPALSREDGIADDLATEMMDRLASRDVDITELWLRLRDWALDGQRTTFQRLGVDFDRIFLESDYVSDIAALRDLALRRDVATCGDEDAVLYRTGREHYPTLLLNRPDGGATQHLRYLALWWATQPQLRGTRSIQVAGDEWRPLTTYADEILRTIAPDDETHPSTCLLHGMVTVGGQQVKSSRGEPLLVDALIDLLESRLALSVRGRDGGRVDPTRIAVTVALGLMLNYDPRKRVDVSIDDFVSAKAGAGWTLAQAWIKAWDPRHDGLPDPDVGDARYRFLVIQSQVHRGLVRRAVASLDVEPLMRFYVHLSRWYLDAPDEARLARSMRTILTAAVGSLGLPLA
jgi:arginyl-tRNA synthetase